MTTTRVICAWLLMCAIGFGQAYPDYVPDPAWLSVVNLPVDTDISVKTKRGKYEGYVRETDDDYLVIVSSGRFSDGRRWVSRKFTKDEILEVRLNQRMLSTLAAGAIGAGAGIAVGKIAESRSKSESDDMKGLITAVLGLLGGLLAGAVGHSNPFIGKKIYSKR